MEHPTCFIPDCDSPAKVKAFCKIHYWRWRWTQLPKKRLPDDVEVHRNYVKAPSGCWLWTRPLTKQGYGQFRGKRPHRLIYELMVGPIPAGLTLDHLCRVRSCVNPDHLEPVSRGVNAMRGQGPAALNARKTHCIHGHEFTPENTYVRPGTSGHRHCRTCANAIEKRRKARIRRKVA